MNCNLLSGLRKVEDVAACSVLKRIINHPLKYFNAVLHRIIVYPFTKKERIVTTTLFSGKQMTIALPAATDIYLTGGKSHNSEIRLALFLIKNLKLQDNFLDIGAHFGYFTLLASELVGPQGNIFSFEPTSKSYQILQTNIIDLPSVKCFNEAIANEEGEIIFYEFDNLQSEYNSTDMSQFEQSDWYKKSPPRKVIVTATTVNDVTAKENFNPKIIKIDVEGAEDKVIAGGLKYFKENSPIIIMEFLDTKRNNSSHVKASNSLLNIGYEANSINILGELIPIKNLNFYLQETNQDSDNIVFVKSDES
jgi:FkbM family methyltransferase